MMAGRAEAGLTLLGEVEADGGHAPEAALVMGDLLLAASPSNEDQARRLFQAVSESAQAQKALMFELQAATRLCRLVLLEGDAENAHRQLREIYGQFTEGFDTPDLLEARALLDELESQGST
jgi:predicted ATPase